MTWLNLNPIVPSGIAVGILVLIALIIMTISLKIKKIHHLVFIKLSILGMSLVYFFEAFANLFLNNIFLIVSGITLVPTTIFILIGVNYIMREKVNTVSLVITCCLGVILCFIVFIPGAIVSVKVNGFIMIQWLEWSKLITELFHILFVGIIAYWGIISWESAPFLIKNEADQFLIAVSFMVIRAIVNLLVYIHPIWIMVVNIVFAVGVIIFTLVITNEPKILFIFPFSLNRLLIRDKSGYLLFDQDWSKSKISEQVFTGFLNAIQLMSNEVVNLGGVLDIDLKEGILMIHESDYISVGLISTKSSKFLRNALTYFVEDFEKTFEQNLKEGIKDPKKYESAYLLIDKYFANFPIRLIEGRREQIMLESKYLEIPKQLEQQLEKVAQNQEELDLLKSELQKAPIGFTADFFDLYEKLSREDQNQSDE
ncbi:MAG: hypothetical protein ACFFE5_13665 [Candidatus Thorarchaeota archaeon]